MSGGRRCPISRRWSEFCELRALSCGCRWRSWMTTTAPLIVMSARCRPGRGNASRIGSARGRLARRVADAEPEPLSDEAAAAIVAVLHRHGVRFVVIGGFAIQLHEVDGLARTSD